MLTSAWTTKLTLTKSKIASVIENGAQCAPFFLFATPPFSPRSRRKKGFSTLNPSESSVITRF
ncbi:hypothetical protein D4100_03425 [Serratia inhibens]|uniref:Uncharacterized protein n=1 Tax=Serratia inhibens TaxID=2338073 RepID=A0AA93BXL6_9GAMM|nr:hypothetical protein D4100_03425 [Serratia inhibens]